MTHPFISIILPIYNQADHIERVILEYEERLTKISNPYEIILVVNGCQDNSLAVCQSLSQQYPFIHLIQSQRAGWGLAVLLGIEAARGDLLCYTNSARTNAQDLVLLLLYALTFPDNIVIKANRKIRESWQRRMGSLLYNLECRALFDLSFWDINGTPKVFPRAFNKLLALTRDDDLIDAEFNITCRREGYPMLEVPIFSTRRYGGKSTTNYRSALKMYWGIFKLWNAIRLKKAMD
jgi:glycosyltransferase involved in cell wall biosynthesis